MKMKNLILFVGIISMSAMSCKTLTTLISPTSFETVAALKEVMNSSAFRAIQTINSLNGGAESALPASLKPVLNTLKALGLGGEIDKINQHVANASRIAGKESALIMKDAIAEVTFQDAAAVVLSGGDAATTVLKEKMYGSVTKRYSARLDQELNKTDALKYWGTAAEAYNLFASKKVDSSLSDFLAKRAVDAAFLGMGVEEKKIRTDYKSLGSSVVTKVFDYYGSKKS